MIQILIFPPGLGLPSLSPFCAKTIYYCRLSGIEHEVKVGDPSKSPTGKLPCIRYDGGVLSDSGRIERFLVERFGDRLDDGLGPEQRALGHLVRRTCEESLYFVLVWSRWIDESGWPHQREAIRPMLPAPLRGVIPSVIRRKVRKDLFSQGVGRHDRDDIYRIGVEDLEALNGVVSGEHRFLFSDRPTSYDVIVHAFAGSAMNNRHDNPLTDAMRRLDRLRSLCEAVEEAQRDAASSPPAPSRSEAS